MSKSKVHVYGKDNNVKKAFEREINIQTRVVTSKLYKRPKHKKVMYEEM